MFYEGNTKGNQAKTGHITSKELTIPDLLAANAVDKNPAWASQGTRPKPMGIHVFSARRPQGGNSYRLHIRAIN